MGLSSIRSMTGFGSGQAKVKNGMVIAEIKTVNHKFLEISCKLPNSFAKSEDKVKMLVQKRIKRGKVYLNLTHEGLTLHNQSLQMDMALAKKYHTKLVELKKQFSIKEGIRVNDIVSFPGVLNYKSTERDNSKIWPLIQKAINQAIYRLVLERQREGRHLIQDIMKRLTKIKQQVSQIKKRSYFNVKKYKKKLEQKIKEISGLSPANNDRLEMEVALYAKNSDISEEITRLTSHVLNFDRIVKVGGEVGKKLDFVAQEMHREINTVGAKSSDYMISSGVIEVKSLVEKIREQLKNLE